MNTSNWFVKKEDNKAKILDLFIDIVLDTGKEPTIDELAARTTVSRRTILNYYQDKNEIIRELRSMIFKRVESLFPQVDGKENQPIEELLDLILSRRAEIYEYLSPIFGILESRKQEDPILVENAKSNTEMDLNLITQIFSPYIRKDLDPAKTIKIITSTLSWNYWCFMRFNLGLEKNVCQDIIKYQAMMFFTTGD